MNRATHRTTPPTGSAAAELLREAEAQCALAELFPHLKLEALRAIQELFPLQAQHHAHGRPARELAAC